MNDMYENPILLEHKEQVEKVRVLGAEVEGHKALAVVVATSVGSVITSGSYGTLLFLDDAADAIATFLEGDLDWVNGFEFFFHQENAAEFLLKVTGVIKAREVDYGQSENMRSDSISSGV